MTHKWAKFDEFHFSIGSCASELGLYSQNILRLKVAPNVPFAYLTISHNYSSL